MKFHGLVIANSVACAVLAAGALAGDHPSFPLLGYDDLVERLGDDTPTGAGVIVSEVEPTVSGNYAPDLASSHFDGMTITLMSGDSGISSHSNKVARYLAGNQWSIAPGVSDLFVWETLDWLTGGWMHTSGGTLIPDENEWDIKLLNNSWIGSFGSVTVNNDALRRIDYFIQRDNVFMTNGIPNAGDPLVYPLVYHGYNGISVGVRQGTHLAGDTANGVDGQGRMKPEIVGPADYSSYATPMVNAAGALLVETARTDPVLSGDPDAESSILIKAVLMAGAVHENDPGPEDWTNNPVASGPMRGFTARPLDEVFGAGTVNINTAHLILTGGRQEGLDGPPSSGSISHRGWDVPDILIDGSRFWRMQLTEEVPELSFMATWNRRIRTNFTIPYMPDFELILWQEDASGALQPLEGEEGASWYGAGNVRSNSDIDNVEHLYISDLAAGTYVLEIRRLDEIFMLPPAWSVAVAWLFSEQEDPPPDPADINGDGIVDFADLLEVLSVWGSCPGCAADINGDGFVDFADLLLILSSWG